MIDCPRDAKPASGFGRHADARSRSVRIRNLPKGTQEGLLQQALEKHGPVKRVELFADINEATAEFENAAVCTRPGCQFLPPSMIDCVHQEAGKFLLRTESITFNDKVLQISEEAQTSGRSANKTVPFAPRAAISRPRAGLGHKRAGAQPGGPSQNPPDFTSGSSTATNKSQDDFRKMLGGK